jgi:hypothetical protein
MDISSKYMSTFFIVYPIILLLLDQAIVAVYFYNLNYVTSVVGIVEIQGTGEVTNPNSSKSNIYRDISLQAKW